MKFKTLLKAGVVAGSALAAATASAVPVTFDFSNGKTESNATYRSVDRRSFTFSLSQNRT